MTHFHLLQTSRAFSDNASDAARRGFEKLENMAALQDIQQDGLLKNLLAFIFTYSPYLTRIILHYPDFFAEICLQGTDASFEGLKASLERCQPVSRDALMQELRIAKSKSALLTAVADITGSWKLEKVTAALSEFAEICVRLTVNFLLRGLASKKEIVLKTPDNPAMESGIFVLAMGKMGAYELNYSSDIDLIVFFESGRIAYTGQSTIQQTLSRMTQEMVRILQERNALGYVFRVDLRLRPDPASTPAAMSVAGAITYYETVGQNWERAAFIKARPIAGDMEAGYRFLQQIAPFIWRKHLDFAAIADIQSIKRQMDEKTGKEIHVPGHNIKTGIGGIREIEFFCQINQLIWGGRISQLRIPGTCQALGALVEAGLIAGDQAEKLIESYRFLRNTEHRLQMVDDQQTHTIPVTDEALQQIAEFAFYHIRANFEQAVKLHLESVHANFVGAFRSHGSLSSDYGKLSFTGVENDPQTLETLAKIGYQNPAPVSDRIQAWHRGAYRSTRTRRARELITEMTPMLLKLLAENTAPDQAFMKFDEFLARLPAGIQLFSLFHANPELLGLMSLIMGCAPAMAEQLSKNPALLDAVMTNDFYHEFPDKNSLFTVLSSMLSTARDYEDEMDMIRRFRNEKQFQAGVQLIRNQTKVLPVSHYLSDIADVCLEAMLHCAENHFRLRNPALKSGCLAVIALGRLGARELTFGSDIDMVFVYDSDVQNALLSSNHSIYNKLSERFITGVTALTREGRLYEIDTRLRPSGGNGALAVSDNAFEKYFRESAWTFEVMAFTRARVITGNPALRQKIHTTIQENILRPRSAELIRQDISVLREKITREFGSDIIWNLKYVHGGLMDLDFLAQYYVLVHAKYYPDILCGSSQHVFENMVRHQLITAGQGKKLMEAHQFMGSLLAIFRLCGQGLFDEQTAPDGLKQLIADIMEEPDFETVKHKLIAILALVRAESEIISGGLQGF